MTSDPRANNRLEQLVLASVALTVEPSLERVLDRVVNIAADIIGARYAAIGVLAPDGRTLERFVTRGLSAEERTRIGDPPRGHGILGLVIREGRPVRLGDLNASPHAHGFPAGHPPMRSFLGVPITGRRAIFGNLYLTEKTGGQAFTEDDERIAVLLATMCAAAVENARLHEESARLLEEVQQLLRARERFFAMVNHELRNALAAVYGWAEMLVRKKDPASVPRAAREVLDSAEQAIALINDLLDLSRLDENRLKLVPRPVEPVSIAQRAAGRVTPAAESRGIRIQVEQASALPVIQTDASRVEQILVNLLVNAIKHGPGRSPVHVVVNAEDSRISYSVVDEGPGIPASDAEHVFDIYVTRSESSGEGLGLGLPLSRRLARLLGGELRAVTDRPRGGCFVLELPVNS